MTEPNVTADPRPRVWLTMPRHHMPAAEQMMAALVFAAGDGPESCVPVVDPRIGSLLANSFNQGWAGWLRDGTCPYWCLLHADVAPRGEGWLAKMVRLLDASPHAAIHAVCAIKDNRGMTSTAVGPSKVEERFSPVRRVTQTELQKLPEVFDYADVCRVTGEPEKEGWCLLPNTGCLLVRRDRFPWRQFRGFNIDDALAWVDSGDGKGEQPYAHVAPEDWQFGRWCGRNGVSVGGTRAVTTIHYGPYGFASDSAWGDQATDETYLQACREIEARRRQSEPAAAGAGRLSPP